jgi:hypothetical protein
MSWANRNISFQINGRIVHKYKEISDRSSISLQVTGRLVNMLLDGSISKQFMENQYISLQVTRNYFLVGHE